MSATAATEQPEGDLEEPYSFAVRVALGLRPTTFLFGDPTIDPRPCPPWCHYGLNNDKHDVNQAHPFDAHHALGVEPEVALSNYPADYLRDSEGTFVSTSALRVALRQVGQSAPTVELHAYIKSEPERRPSLDLSIGDAKELVAALTYVVALAEGERSVVEGAE
ncbi:hypothetical protein GCM10027596_16730 [Nocardioides korecus]